MKNQPKHIILHHSATPRDYTTFEAIKNYHINKRNYSDIGYHWLITGDGQVHEGRPEFRQGAHCRQKVDGISMNYQSIGICLTGNFTREEPSKEQLESLDKLLDIKRKQYNIPSKNILGHRETGASTLCPAGLVDFIIDYRGQIWNKISVNNKIKLKKQIIIIQKMILVYKKLLSLLKRK